MPGFFDLMKVARSGPLYGADPYAATEKALGRGRKTEEFLGRKRELDDPEFAAELERQIKRVQLTNERRKPRDPNAPMDRTEQLLLDARRRQLASLGIGATRASSFASVAQPLAATTSLFRS